jgi:hypothetical protein
MPKGKLSPEAEIIAAYGAAMVAAFQVLLNCLERLRCSMTFGRRHLISLSMGLLLG